MGTSRQLAVGPVAMVSLLLEAGLRGQLSEEQSAARGDCEKPPDASMCRSSRGLFPLKKGYGAWTRRRREYDRKLCSERDD